MIQRRFSVQNDIFLHNTTPDFCNTISCQALGNAHFPVLKNSPIVFLPKDYLCAQKDIREMFSPKYMGSFRHADSLELQEVLSVSHFPQHIYHSPRQTILTFQVLCFYILTGNIKVQVNLRHLPTSANFHQDIILHTQVVHQ